MAEALRETRPDCTLVEFLGAWKPLDASWRANAWLASTRRAAKELMWAAHASQTPLPVPGADPRPLAQRYFEGLQDGNERLRVCRGVQKA